MRAYDARLYFLFFFIFFITTEIMNRRRRGFVQTFSYFILIFNFIYNTLQILTKYKLFTLWIKICDSFEVFREEHTLITLFWQYYTIIKFIDMDLRLSVEIVKYPDHIYVSIIITPMWTYRILCEQLLGNRLLKILKNLTFFFSSGFHKMSNYVKQ